MENNTIQELPEDEQLALFAENVQFNSADAPSLATIELIIETLKEGTPEGIADVRKAILKRFRYIEERDGKEGVKANDGYLYRIAFDYEDALGKDVPQHAIGACWCSLKNFIKMNGYTKFRLSEQDVNDACGTLAEIVTKKLSKYDPNLTKVSAYFHNDMTDILLQTKGQHEKKYHNDLMGRVERAISSYAAEGFTNPSVTMIADRINAQGYVRDVKPRQILNCLRRKHEMVSMADLSHDLPDDLMGPEERFIQMEERENLLQNLNSLPETEMKGVVLNYLKDVDPNKVSVGNMYDYAVDRQGYKGSKNSFEHEFRLFKRSLMRKYGVNPSHKNDPKRSIYASITSPTMTYEEMEEIETEIFEGLSPRLNVDDVGKKPEEPQEQAVS